MINCHNATVDETVKTIFSRQGAKNAKNAKNAKEIAHNINKLTLRALREILTFYMLINFEF
jgi:hypothetical protein